MIWGEIIYFAGSFYDLLNPGITKFEDIARIHIDQVIVLHALVCFFKLSYVFPKLVLDNKTAVK